MLALITIVLLLLLTRAPAQSRAAVPDRGLPEAAGVPQDRRPGALSNEALPPDREDKLQEKKMRAWEKWKNLKSLRTPPEEPVSQESKMDPEVEEFFVEHEISGPLARLAARKLNVSEIPAAAGCEACSTKDMEYCAGSQVMNDHCCCDSGYAEVFPFVPHTCYLGTERCSTVASDCGEYGRLRTCCCDKHLAIKWKALLSNKAMAINTPQPLQRLWILSWATVMLINPLSITKFSSVS